MVPGFASVLVSRFMELFEPGNGGPSHIEIGYKIVLSCDMCSIDEIYRGYARANTLDGLKLELCSATDTRFSEAEISECDSNPTREFSENPGLFFLGVEKFSKIDFRKMKR